MKYKVNAKRANEKKNNLAFRIIPEFIKSNARFGISGSFIKLNQKLEKKNAMDNPNSIKMLKVNKYEKFLFWFLNFKKLLLTKIAAAGVAGNQ